MFKKMACFALLSTASAIGFAGAMGPVAMCQGVSFFVGAAGGIGMLQGDYSASDFANRDRVYTHLGQNNFLAGAVFGLETVLPNTVYLAVVGNGLYNSQSDTVFTSANHIATIQNNFQFGANLRLGVQMGNITPYILGGAEAGTWRLGLDNPGNSWNRGIAPRLFTDTSDTRIGPQAGAGVLLNLNNYWSLGLEYAHTWFGNVSMALNDGLTFRHWVHQANINQDQVLFSAAYKFNTF